MRPWNLKKALESRGHTVKLVKEINPDPSNDHFFGLRKRVSSMDSENITGYYLKQDNDSHWYIVPESQINSFESLLEDISTLDMFSDEYHDSELLFNIKFGENRVDGPHCIKILTYEEEY